jgi:predicted house-cleaning noncanonical NTP pyrophosphatase (MazG superfamily)
MIYNKAVRDKIPELIKESGSTCNVKTLSNDEFLDALERKLVEEIKEYQQSKSIEELADIMEVIFRISNLKGTSVEKLEEIRKEKTNKRGAFEKNLFLIDTENN